MGVAVVEPFTNSESLLRSADERSADEALYQAKRNGRNRVESMMFPSGGEVIRQV